MLSKSEQKCTQFWRTSCNSGKIRSGKFLSMGFGMKATKSCILILINVYKVTFISSIRHNELTFVEEFNKVYQVCHSNKWIQ